MKASVKTIAGLTGFSPATVSNALNHKKGVNKETAAKIFQTARELGYLEENRVTKVKFVKYKKNGLIVDDTPFFPLLIDGVAEECRASGLEMAVCTLDSRDASYEEQVKWLLNDRASAVILLGTELMEEELDIYRGAACPLLLLDNWSADMSFNGVLINNSDSARMATEYLIGKGHRKIGYLRGGFRIKALRQQTHQRLGKRHAQQTHGGSEQSHPGKEAAGEPERVLFSMLLHPLSEDRNKAGGDGSGKNSVKKRSGNPAGG